MDNGFFTTPTEKLKQLIKDLAREQTELKAKRKTGTLPEWPRTRWGEIIWSDIETAQTVKINNALSAADTVRRNRPRITAAIDLYHELRGSDYRSNRVLQSKDFYWGMYYDRYLAELRKEFVPKTMEQ